MNLFRKLSIRGKLMLIVMATSSSAVLLVAITISISFPRIESFRNKFMSALRRGSITPNGSRHPQQLRTHFEPGARRSAQIYFKPHSFVFD